MAQERRQSDQDEAVESYQARMPRLARIMGTWSNRVVDAMRTELKQVLERTGYDPMESLAWALHPADAVTVNRLTELAGMAPRSVRQSAAKHVLDMIRSGRLTNRAAVKEIFKLEAYAFVDALRTDVAGILVGVAEEGMYRGQFMLQKAQGVGWSFDEIGEQRVTTFVGHRFTESQAYRFLRPLQRKAAEDFDQSIDQGDTPAQVDAKLLNIKRSSVGRSQREARTTISEVSNDAHMDAYKAAGTKQYRFVATFDERTCPVCGKLDGQKFNVEDQEVGVNYPPIHPNCRCTTVAVFSKEIEDLMRQRRYTDRATGITHDIPRDFSYQDWYKTFGPGRTDGIEYVPKYKPKK